MIMTRHPGEPQAQLHRVHANAADTLAVVGKRRERGGGILSLGVIFGGWGLCSVRDTNNNEGSSTNYGTLLN